MYAFAMALAQVEGDAKVVCCKSEPRCCSAHVSRRAESNATQRQGTYPKTVLRNKDRTLAQQICKFLCIRERRGRIELATSQRQPKEQESDASWAGTYQIGCNNDLVREGLVEWPPISLDRSHRPERAFVYRSRPQTAVYTAHVK